MVALPPPVAAAKEGLGPDGRKKLKNAGVPTNCPFSAARGPGQPPSTPSALGAITPMPQVEAVGATFAAGATTVTGLVNPSPAASALNRFCFNCRGSVEFMAHGRFMCC